MTDKTKVWTARELWGWVHKTSNEIHPEFFFEDRVECEESLGKSGCDYEPVRIITGDQRDKKRIEELEAAISEAKSIAMEGANFAQLPRTIANRISALVDRVKQSEVRDEGS